VSQVTFDWFGDTIQQTAESYHSLLCMLIHCISIKVERTKDRPIACGEITRLKAFAFLGLPLSAALAILLSLNQNTSVFFIV